MMIDTSFSKRIRIILMAVLLLMKVASGANIFVATNGSDDSGTGSESNPYQSIQKGLDMAVDGDVVLVQDGTYSGEDNRNLDFDGLRE